MNFGYIYISASNSTDEYKEKLYKEFLDRKG